MGRGAEGGIQQGEIELTPHILSTSPRFLEETSMIGGLAIRLSVEADMEHWKRWVADPEVLRWFPLSSEEEIDKAARFVFSFLPRQALLTAECDGQPCGIAGLVLPEYRKIRHQAEFSIIVAKSHRNLGVGSSLLQALLARGKAWHGLRLALSRCSKAIRLVLYIREWDSSILVFSPSTATWGINSWGVI